MPPEPTPAPAPAAAAPAQPAPATPPAPAPVPAPAAPAAAPVTDYAAEVARLQAQNAELLKHNRTWEARAKANENAAPLLEQITKALGMDKPDPAVVAQQLAAATAEKTQLARERAVLLAASTVGANAAALLDSRTFAQQIAGIDPADSAAIQAAMTAAVAANPLYAAASTTPAVAQQPAAPVHMATSAGPNGQPTGGNDQWTADDVHRASPAALSEAMSKGQLKNYLAS